MAEPSSWDEILPDGKQEEVRALAPSEWDKILQPVEPTATEKARTLSQGAVGEALKFGGAATGMLAGAEVGTLGGPLAPITVPVGAAVGAASGYIAGKGTQEYLSTFEFPGYGAPLTYRNVEELPENLRPYAYAGEAIGGGVPFAAAPAYFALKGLRLPVTKVGGFLNRIVDTAAKYPGTFMAAEVSGLFGSGVGAGAAETYAPGSAGWRFLGEVGGGIFNPSRIMMGTARGGIGVVRNFLHTMSPSGRETKAAKYIQNLLELTGENPHTLAETMRKSGIPGTDLTPAQKSGSPALIALEAKLRSESIRFGADAKAQADDSLVVIHNLIESLSKTGDPQALVTASKVRKDYFTALLAQNLKVAEAKAIKAALDITEDTPAARSALSRQVRDILDDTLKMARKAESELWEQVPKNIESAADSVISAYGKLRGELLPEEALPAIIEGFVKRVGEEGTTSGELLRLRSRALAMAKDAAAQGKWDEARMLGTIAEAALDDMDIIPDASLEAARTFSRELNDTYSRTFAGQALAKGRTGAQRIPPELLMHRALAGGKEAAALRFRELEEATRFLPDRGLGGAEAARNFEATVETQERFLRMLAAEAIDPQTGRVSTGRLAKMMRDNEELLTRFPEVKQTLETAIKEERSALLYSGMAQKATRVIERQAEFSRIAGLGSAVDAMEGAIRGKNPVKTITDMVKVARRGGPEAVKGLQAAAYDYAIRTSKNAQGDFSFRKFKATLFDPIRPDTPALVDVLVQQGVMAESDIKQLDTLLDEAMRIEAAIDVSADVKSLMAHMEQAVPDPDALTDLIIRIHGAKVGAALAGETTGATLVAAGRGSSFFRHLFNKMPQNKVQSVLIEAASNPEFMALLLEKPTTPEKAFGIGMQIHAYMFHAGISPFVEE